MPFLALPSDDSQLRYADDPIVLHYLVSTPECRTFAAAQTHASKLAASLMPSSPRPAARRERAHSAQRNGRAAGVPLGLPTIDALLPEGGLLTGALHEIGNAREDALLARIDDACRERF